MEWPTGSLRMCAGFGVQDKETGWEKDVRRGVCVIHGDGTGRKEGYSSWFD